MKKFATILLLFFTINAPSIRAQEALIISQYYEGTSNNRWVEVTNMGTATIDFSATPYYLCLFSNANADAPSTSTHNGCFTFSGTLAAGGVVLLKNSAAALPSYASGTSSAIIVFNGDDLIIITKNPSITAGVAWAARTDVVGNGTTWGADTSFSRNLNVAPQTTWSASNFSQFTNAAVDAATSGNNEYIGTYTGYTALPIELAGFSATVNDDEATIQWTTASESNNDRFIIEQQTAKGWKQVGEVQSVGNSTTPTDYQFTVSNLSYGQQVFRLLQIDKDGNSKEVAKLNALIELTESYALSEAYPNPFATSANFSLAVAESQLVIIKVYDIQGRHVATLHEGNLAGQSTHEFQLDGTNLSAARYIIQVEGQSFSANKMITLVK